MAKWTPDQLSMFSLWTSEASPSATSSPGSGDGATPSASPGGPTTGLCGLEAAPASRSRSQAKAPELTMPVTSGPTSTASSPPADPLSFWESKLRARLGTDGSMEFELIWKQLATPAGRSIFRLSRSAPRTFASASTGSPSTWWTPKASQTMGRYSRVNGKIYPGLWMQAEGTVATTWPTPNSTVTDAKPRPPITTGRKATDPQISTADVAVHLYAATWPTPTKADGDGGHGMGTATSTGRRENGTKITVSLPGVVKIVSTWPTPLQQDCRVPATPESAQREWDHSNLRGIAAVTTWPTPTSQDCARGVGTIRPQDTGIPLPQRVAQVIGTTTSGSPDQTVKPGALNPAFPCWLMGYPTAWDACAPTATPSSRRSRQKS